MASCQGENDFESPYNTTANRGLILFINTTCEEEGFLSESVLPDVKLALNVVNNALPMEMKGLNVSTLNVDTRVSFIYQAACIY